MSHQACSSSSIDDDGGGGQHENLFRKIWSKLTNNKQQTAALNDKIPHI